MKEKLLTEVAQVFNDRRKIPKICGIYVIYLNTEIMYIGSSQNIKYRFSTKYHPYYDIVKKGRNQVTIECFEDAKDYRLKERILISQHKPPYNKFIPVNSIKNTFLLSQFTNYQKYLILKNNKLILLLRRWFNCSENKLLSMVLYDSQTLFHICVLEVIANELNMEINELKNCKR